MPSRKFRWSERAGRYQIEGKRAGQFVSRAEIRTAIDRTLEQSNGRFRALGESLRDGRLTIAEWQMAVHQEIKSVHLWNTAASKGGWSFVTQADYGRVGRIVRDQLVYLRGFAKELEAGLPRDGRFLSRMELYAQAGRGTYHRMERVQMEARGFTEAKSVLHPADHCQTCVSEAEQDFRPVEQVIPITQRECGPRDKCSMLYRNPQTGEIAA